MADNSCAAGNLREGMLFGMGNPLLDMMVHVDEAFLAKYKLQPNNAILAEDIHIPMYEELRKNYTVDFAAGGACQNVMRAVQWIVEVPKVATFMGGIGNDENGKTLTESATQAGVNAQYQISATYPTGTCAALVTGSHRSLCAYLAAAEKFTISHLEEHFEYVKKAAFYYITGFFLTVSPDSALKVAKYASEQNRPFVFNLSAPFIVQFFNEQLSSVLPYADIIFGNESEAKALSDFNKWGTDDMTEIAKKMVELPKSNSQRSRIVIITQGHDPVIVAEKGKDVQTFPVVPIAVEDIVDTNGAGDSFVGGFLAQYIQDKPLPTCVRCGLWAAHHVIQQSGVKYPTNVHFGEV